MCKFGTFFSGKLHHRKKVQKINNIISVIFSQPRKFILLKLDITIKISATEVSTVPVLRLEHNLITVILQCQELSHKCTVLQAYIIATVAVL